LILAVRFLTIVPLPGRASADPSALGRAAWWFPVVGLMLGLVLAAAERFLYSIAPPLVEAALLVVAWKIVTGGIHLDGLADCLDGLAGPNAARRRAIMQDSRIGVFGAAGLVLVLILFVSCLAELPAPIRGRVLVLAPVMGRVGPLLAGAWLRPAVPGRGLGGAFVAGLSGWAGHIYAPAGLILAAWLLGPWGAAIAIGALGLALLWACFAAGRFAGLTGDVLGAVVEVGELATVLLGVLAAHRGLI
jgi:adenosylcobinamide-GDP ribazoletransferase